jgi:NAD(P)-dependent dehydrogenase (short-subunit alcohol dehydrogenase family)
MATTYGITSPAYGVAVSGATRTNSRNGDNDMGKLDNKVAVITGGSSGIGLATAQRFVEEGASVVIVGRGQEDLDKAQAEIGHNVSTVAADVANLDDLDRLWKAVQDEHGGVDVIVSNAAFVELSTLSEATPEHFDRTFGVNARGTFFTVQKALPLLRDNGAVVLVSSVAHRIGSPSYTTYAATKAAVRSFARTWGADLLQRGIRVNSISPGPIETPIIDKHYTDGAEARDVLTSHVPMGRMGLADEVASAILFLASTESSYVTGHDLIAGGGQSEI